MMERITPSESNPLEARTCSRRSVLRLGATILGTGLAGTEPIRGESNTSRTAKPVAACITIYQPNSHADVILTKILEGWKHDGGPGPALKLAGLYVDQFPKNDLARKMAEKHGVPIFDTIRDAITLGTKNIQVDGVLSIAEHGEYPWNEKGQHLYPRRRFLTEIADTFEACGRSVPVFNDKHLGPAWEDARWMYDRARELQIPMMAGSSLPYTFRKPDVTLKPNTRIDEILAVGFGGIDSYGFHALECLQTMAEQRSGQESGVRWVQCLTGDEIWKAVDSGAVSQQLLDQALHVTPTNQRKEPRKLSGKHVALIRFQYRDGLRASLFMLSGYAMGMSAACRLSESGQILATQFEMRTEPRFPHFAYLLKSIERMIHTGQPTCPVEKTVLTGGILDRALVSKSQEGQKLDTPELQITYFPRLIPHAPHWKLDLDPTQFPSS